jgi:hypothetical protein
MRFRAFASLLLMGLTASAIAQLGYHPLEVGKQPETAPKAIKLAVWTPRPGSAAHLGPEKSLYGWAFRPPRDFAFTQKVDNGNQIFIFQGDPRPDTSAPILWVITGALRPGKSSQPKDEVLLDMYILQLHQNRENFHSTEVQYGSVQGRRFIRRRWTGTETNNGVTRRVRGVVYMTLVGQTFTAVTVQDSDPGANTTIGMMENSVFTLHKR